MQEAPRPGIDVQDALQRLAHRDLRQTALIAFVVGVLFHVFVIYAVLGTGGGGGGGSGSGSSTGGGTQSPGAVPVVQGTPTSIVPPDRTDCNAIRNTNYRSDAERAWFLKNCTGA